MVQWRSSRVIIALLFSVCFMNKVDAETLQVDEHDTTTTKILVSLPRTIYMGNGYDFFMLSSSWYNPGAAFEDRITAPRFTGVLNFGVNFHYDATIRLGFFTGIGLKNLGFNHVYTGPTIGSQKLKITERVYTIGVPLGVKFGNLRDRNFFFVGGGLDIPFHYKYKAFYKGHRYNKETKQGEFFSKKTATVMPYVFIGVSLNPGITLKAQYYPTNFYNESYSFVDAMGATITPYKGVRVHLFSLVLSFDIHYNQYKIQERDYQKKLKQRDSL